MSPMSPTAHSDKLNAIREDIGELKDNLSMAVKELSIAISGLKDSNNGLGTKLEVLAGSIGSSIENSKSSLPLSVVGFMCLIILGVVFGKEMIVWGFEKVGHEMTMSR